MDNNDNISLAFMADEYLVLVINDQKYGFPISTVNEILKVQKITRVPSFPYYAKGIVNLRGMVFPVVDMRLRFDFPEVPYDDKTCIVLTSCNGHNIGFVVDTVASVVDIPAGKVAGVPRIAPDCAAYTIGIAKVNEEIIILLDPGKLLSEEMIEQVESSMDSKEE